MIWSFLSSQVPLLIYLLFGRSGLNPATCFGQPDIQSLVDCFDSYTVPEAFYNSSTYAIAQPTDAQRNDWKHLIRDLLVIDGSCESIPIPSSLRSIYDVRPFQKYCVLYETTSSSGYYRKGWGLVVVQAHQSQVARDLHFSAPHPAYDLGTPQQAAAVFSLTSARSLLIAGRNRNAFMQPSTCVPPRSSTDDWYLTDPAHNNLESFFDASTTIYDWQHATRGCSSSNCAFVQFHGKGSKTCPQDSIFMSSGLGSSPSSVAWYTDEVDRPIKRLLEALRHIFPSEQISLPSNSICKLTATNNVVGRYVNNIPISEVCDRAANSTTASGEFVHIEQALTMRSGDNYIMWAQAFKDAF